MVLLHTCTAHQYLCICVSQRNALAFIASDDGSLEVAPPLALTLLPVCTTAFVVDNHQTMPPIVHLVRHGQVRSHVLLRWIIADYRLGTAEHRPRLQVRPGSKPYTRG